MSLTYPLRGANATVTSWGGTFYSALLAAMTPASMAFNIQNDGQDITGIGAFPLSEIAGLVSGTAVIGGYAGSSPYLGVYASITASAGTVAPYIVDVQSINLVLRSAGEEKITTGSSGSPASFESFMPNGNFGSTATWTCLVDQNTPLVMPDVRSSAALNVLTFTYGSGQSLAFATGNIRTLSVRAVRGNKQIVTYSANSVGNITPVGALLSGTVFSSSNPFPFWSGPTVTAQPLVGTLHSTPRSITFADSFATAVSITATPGAPVGVEVGIRGSGAITIV